MGLLDMYELAGSKKALDVAVNFGKWFYDWSGKYTEAQFQEILDVETGGIFEIWVILYRITKDEMFRTLMDRYYRKSLFDGLLAGKDVLTNMHANTTIPEILGAAAAYEVTGEQRYLDIAQAYRKSAVTDRGSYVTGGQTCGEIWSAPNQLKARLGDKNQEHCTVYNMMRLARFPVPPHTGSGLLGLLGEESVQWHHGPGLLAGQLYAWKKVGISDKRITDLFSSAARGCSEGMGIQNAGLLLLPWITGAGECGA